VVAPAARLTTLKVPCCANPGSAWIRTLNGPASTEPVLAIVNVTVVVQLTATIPLQFTTGGSRLTTAKSALGVGVQPIINIMKEIINPNNKNLFIIFLPPINIFFNSKKQFTSLLTQISTPFF
jgi:hypothetical protein